MLICDQSVTENEKTSTQLIEWSRYCLYLCVCAENASLHTAVCVCVCVSCVLTDGGKGEGAVVTFCQLLGLCRISALKHCLKMCIFVRFVLFCCSSNDYLTSFGHIQETYSGFLCFLFTVAKK